jgi:hypothetical protein
MNKKGSSELTKGSSDLQGHTFGRIYVIWLIHKFIISDYHVEDNCNLQSDPY